MSKSGEKKQIEERQLRILKPFGPSIARATIPKTLVEKLNNYIDQIIEDEKKANELDIGADLVGNVTQEFELEKDFSKKVGWESFLKRGIESWISFATGKKIKSFELINTWVVRQFKNEYNPIHWHSGHISGVGYLKVPKSLGATVQKVKEEKKLVNLNGNLQLIHGNRMFLCDSTATFKPEVGDFYFFPNYMMHAVYPFADSNDERRSISFNANVDSEIYSVYGK